MKNKLINKIINKTNKVNSLLPCSLIIFIFSSINFAKANSDMLYEMSLAELLTVKVTSPSKSLLSQNNTPGIITTLTAQEITMFGGRDLGEVLSRVTGFEEFPSLVNGRNITTIRGDKPSANNNHVLILLNGTPLNRESYTGGIWNEAILLSIPLQSIEQLEVIRGPGSVLYGTNAFAGVVNIITKDEDTFTSQFSLTKGRYNTEMANLSLSGQWQDWQWTTALRWSETDGWPFKTNDAAGGHFEANAYSRSPSILTTVKKNNFSANFFWGQANQFTARGSTNFQEAGKTDNEKYFIDLAYEININKNWLITTNLSHVGGRTKHRISGAEINQMSHINYETNDSRLELTLQSKLSENSNFLMGSTVDYFSGKTPPPRMIVPNWHNYLFALYAQYDIQIEATKYIIGAQYNKAEGSFDSLVPRFGIIHHFNENSGVKLLYGQAFRSPYVVEKSIDVSFAGTSLQGDENLEPETVTTFDLQYFYQDHGISLAATLFRNKQKDLIIRSTVAPGELKFVNKGELTIEGIELEGKYTLDNWYVMGSYTHQSNKGGEGMSNNTLQPSDVVKLGISYRGNHWHVALFDTYFSAYKDNAIVKPFSVMVNEDSEAIHRFSANIHYQPPVFKQWKISVYFDNLLDETLNLPVLPAAPSQFNTRPAMSGRFFMLTVNREF